MLVRRILSDFNFVYLNIRMFIMTESYIDEYAKGDELSMNREKELRYVKRLKCIFIFFYTLYTAGYVFS